MGRVVTLAALVLCTPPAAEAADQPLRLELHACHSLALEGKTRLRQFSEGGTGKHTWRYTGRQPHRGGGCLAALPATNSWFLAVSCGFGGGGFAQDTASQLPGGPEHMRV